MANELKPCPFCGESAVMLHQKYYLAECGNCDTSFMAGPVGIGWYETEEDAATDWNNRPQEAYLQNRVDSLDAMLTESVQALKAAEKRIAEREEDKLRLTSVINSEANRADAAEKKLATPIKIVDYDEFFICHVSGASDDYCKGWVDGRNAAARDVGKAGFTVEEDEQ